MNQGQHKSWLSPMVCVLYSAVAVSGIFMLFHLKLPGMRILHEWGGVLFIVAAIFHLALNWRTFISYLKNSRAALGIGAGIVLIFAMLLVGSQLPDQSHDRTYNNRHLSSHFGQ